jgi:hypothetical protein
MTATLQKQRSRRMPKGPLSNHDRDLGRRRGGRRTRSDHLGLGQGTSDWDCMRDTGHVRRRRGWRNADSLRRATKDLGLKWRVVNLHRDFATCTVVDRVDGSVVANAKGHRKGLHPEDQILWDGSQQGLHGQGTILSSLAQERVHFTAK